MPFAEKGPTGSTYRGQKRYDSSRVVDYWVFCPHPASQSYLRTDSYVGVVGWMNIYRGGNDGHVVGG